jgi:hypothetical protein
MQFDDAWVDQVARGLRACSCFTWIPLYCKPQFFHLNCQVLILHQGYHTTR